MRLLFALLTGCTFGGGPCGQGFTAGVEAGGGFAIVQANAGIDTDAHPYARGDLVVYGDELDAHRGDPPFGGRIGGGVWLTDDHRAVGMFAVGAGGSIPLNTKPCIAEALRVHDRAYSALVELQLRYTGTWQLVLASRLVAAGNFCERT